MNYYTIKPTEKLADFVRFFWVFEGTASETQPYIHRTIANGCPEILFHYQGTFDELVYDNKLKSSFLTGIHGPTNQYRRFIIKEQFGIFGVYLYPYALSALFNIPAIEFTNELPHLFSILKNSDTTIEERMFSAPNNNERVSIITAFLESRLKELKRPEIAYTVKTILKAKGQVNINELSSQCFLSVRQLERNFKEHTGFSPKAFARITRFNSVIGQAQNTGKSLTEIAYSFGYYDQSHFIQDFKTFSGYNPRTYFTGEADELL